MRREQSNKLNFSGQNIYVGIDVHKKNWAVSVLSESIVLKKFSQAPQPEALYRFLATNYPGASYKSAYEAGFCGFWIHHRLRELGIDNIVVNPADVPTMSKEKLRKTDAVDSGKLARELRSGTLTGIYVPNTQTLEIRSLIRLRNSGFPNFRRTKS
jgi:transposase